MAPERARFLPFAVCISESKSSLMSSHLTVAMWCCVAVKTGVRLAAAASLVVSRSRCSTSSQYPQSRKSPSSVSRRHFPRVLLTGSSVRAFRSVFARILMRFSRAELCIRAPHLLGCCLLPRPSMVVCVTQPSIWHLPPSTTTNTVTKSTTTSATTTTAHDHDHDHDQDHVPTLPA